MSRNRKVLEIADAGLTTQDLLDDRVDPTDGWCWRSAWECATYVDGVGPATVYRWGAYDYVKYLAGAGTIRLIFNLSPPLRLIAAKGLKITDLVFVYNQRTVAATTVDVTMSSVTYANNAAPVVAAFGGSLAYDSNSDTNAKRITTGYHLVTTTLGTPQFANTDLVAVAAELVIVAGAGGETDLYGCGFHYTQDYL